MTDQGTIAFCDVQIVYEVLEKRLVLWSPYRSNQLITLSPFSSCPLHKKNENSPIIIFDPTGRASVQPHSELLFNGEPLVNSKLLLLGDRLLTESKEWQIVSV